GNGDDVSYLDVSRDWAGIDLTTEWGKPLVEGEYGIKKTKGKYIIWELYLNTNARAAADRYSSIPTQRR
ncbi:hypothetical protein PZH37_13685, partial [[Eubacterium] siraeum]|nr:hypothetical protein [[Eubacterium] siraeum]